MHHKLLTLRNKIIHKTKNNNRCSSSTKNNNWALFISYFQIF